MFLDLAPGVKADGMIKNYKYIIIATINNRLYVQ